MTASEAVAQAAGRTRARFTGMPVVLRAMLWMSMGGFLFAALNTVMRSVALDMHPLQVQCLRYAFGLVVFLPLLLRDGPGAFRSARPGLHVWRNAVHTAGNSLWFIALPLVQLAEMTAIGFTGPIFMTLGAMLFFGEKVRWRRWAAIAAGFVGVLIVVLPKFQAGYSASYGTILLLLASPVSAASYLFAKTLTRYDRPEIIVAWQCVLVALFAAPMAIVHWSTPSVLQIGLFVVAGVLGSCGHYAVTTAYKTAEVSAVQPMRFLELIWAALFGFIVFADVPPVWTWLGASVIFASTWYIAHREATVRRQAAASAPASVS